jgi:NAD(P)-dependent dehydrogenase (short-subunit alcohol dehydrogenase family)
MGERGEGEGRKRIGERLKNWGNVQKMIEVRNQQYLTKKMGDAWDVTDAALFLGSDEAKYITGLQLLVDGAITCKVV